MNEQQQFNDAYRLFQNNLEKREKLLLQSADKMTGVLLNMHAGGLVAMLAFIGTTYDDWSIDKTGIPFLGALECFALGLILSVVGYFFNYCHSHIVFNKYVSALRLPGEKFIQRNIENTLWNQIAKEGKLEKNIKRGIPFIWLLCFMLFIAGAVLGFHQLYIFSGQCK